MSCKKISKELLSYVNGELSQQRSLEIKEWLAKCSSQRQCATCQAKIAEYNALKTVMDKIPILKLPSHVHYSILDKIQKEQKASSAYRFKFQWKAIPVMFAVILSLCTGSLISNRIFNSALKNDSVDTDFYSMQENSLVEVFTNEGVTP